MKKSEIIKRIEAFAPPELAEKWDCSGWLVETEREEVEKIMLCLTVTEDVIAQALTANCDMIISHHPLFCVPLSFFPSPLGGEGAQRAAEGLIDIYCAHTNLDQTQGGTTDTLISKLSLQQCKTFEGFLRYVEANTTVEEFVEKLREISPNLRYVNNNGTKFLKKIAFCAGSGSNFINEAFESGADALVTGDLKFHTALDSPIVIFDIGHFESEILVLEVFERLLNEEAEVLKANEHSPFIF